MILLTDLIIGLISNHAVSWLAFVHSFSMEPTQFYFHSSVDMGRFGMAVTQCTTMRQQSASHVQLLSLQGTWVSCGKYCDVH